MKRVQNGLFRLMICLTALLGAAPGLTLAGPLDPLTREFATCAGRLSALMEHQWLMSDSRSEDTRAQRAAMLDLLQAVMPEDAGRQALALRIEAKFAQQQLLMQTDFGGTAPERQRSAAARSTEMLRHCALLIGAEAGLRTGQSPAMGDTARESG